MANPVSCSVALGEPIVHRQAMETAFFPCRPGGALHIAPDYVSETFQPGTEQGGHDGADRSMRYLAWRWDRIRPITPAEPSSRRRRAGRGFWK